MTACDNEENGDPIDYSALTGGIWVTTEHSPFTENIPGLALDSSYPIYFTENKDMVIMRLEDGTYRYHSRYAYEIDEVRNMIYLDNGNTQITAYVMALNHHHLTVFFDSDEDSYVCYEWQEFPEDNVDTGSFPKGLLP